MEDIIKTTLIGLFFGTFGTTIGGVIGVKFKNPSKKFLSFIHFYLHKLINYRNKTNIKRQNIRSVESLYLTNRNFLLNLF